MLMFLRRTLHCLPVVALVGAVGAGQELTFRHFAGAVGGAGSEDGTGAEALFVAPGGLASDGEGGLYVSDPSAHVIRRVRADGSASTHAGLAGESSWGDGRGGDARFSFPSGIAADPGGNLFVADRGTHVIRKVSPAGVVATFAGRAGSQGDEDGPGASARFDAPLALGRDGLGNLYVLESGDRVRRVSPEGNVTTLVPDGSPLVEPTGFGVDRAGNVFIADPRAGVIWKLPPNGAWVPFAFISPFWRVFGIAADAAGSVYIADSLSHEVSRTEPDGTRTILVPSPGVLILGSRDGPFGVGRVYRPTAIAVDSAGMVYVADSCSTIRRIGPDGFVSTVAGRSGCVPGLEDGSGPAAGFFRPNSIAVSPSGQVIVGDGSTIRRVSPARGISTLAGSRQHTGSVDGIGSAARFGYRFNLAVAPTESIYVADAQNATIRRVTPEGVVTTLAGQPGSRGDADGSGGEARFRYPSGIAAQPNGDLIVADPEREYRLRRVTPAGLVSTIGLYTDEPYYDIYGNSIRPWSVAVGASGRIYVGLKSSVGVLEAIPVPPGIPEYQIFRTLAGSPEHSGSADGAGENARFESISGMSVTQDGSLLVTDYSTLRRVTPEGVVTTVGGGLGLVVGCADGTGTLARFKVPGGVAVDEEGSILVADTGNFAIRKGTPALPDRATIDSGLAPVGKPRRLGASSGTASSWTWRIVRRPASSTAELSDIRAASPTFVPDVPDLYVFRLEASDFHRESITTVSLRAVDFGDVTGDGRVDVFDLVTLAAHLVGNATPGAAPFLGSPYAARLNAGEAVDVFDLVVLAGYLAGNVAELPAP